MIMARFKQRSVMGSDWHWTCDFCGNQDVVLAAGYRYCAKCSHKLDRVLIHKTIMDAFPSITLERIRQLCGELFETEDYGYSAFPQLYRILDRGGWNDKTQRFNIPTHVYLVMVFDKYLKLYHPNFFDRIKDERRIPTIW
jgi:hypothetical protein